MILHYHDMFRSSSVFEWVLFSRLWTKNLLILQGNSVEKVLLHQFLLPPTLWGWSSSLMPQIMPLVLISPTKLVNQTTFLVKPFFFYHTLPRPFVKVETHRNWLRGREPPPKSPLAPRWRGAQACETPGTALLWCCYCTPKWVERAQWVLENQCTNLFLLAGSAWRFRSCIIRGRQEEKQRGPPLLGWCHCLHVFPCVSESGCSSLTVLFEEGLIQTLHYPEDYNDMANCNWVFQAPKHYLIKVLILAPLPLLWYLHRIANRSTTGQLFIWSIHCYNPSP